MEEEAGHEGTEDDAPPHLVVRVEVLGVEESLRVVRHGVGSLTQCSPRREMQ